MVVSWYLLWPPLILLTAVYSRGTRYPPHVSFVTTLQGGGGGAMFQELKTTLLHEGSITCKIMTSVKAKIWKLLVNAVVAVAKKIILVVNSNSRVFNSNSIFNYTNFNSNSGVGIGIELQFQFRNWIDPNPATCSHNTPHIPSCYNNEQTTKQTKAINNSYVYIHISCKCDTNRVEYFTLDAHASRPVACATIWCPWATIRVNEKQNITAVHFCWISFILTYASHWMLFPFSIFVFCYTITQHSQQSSWYKWPQPS